MPDDDYLRLLRCPIDRQPLTQAPDELVRTVADFLSSASNGRRRNSSDTVRRIDGGLLRNDGLVFYPIVDGIPKLLADEAVDLEQLGLT